MEQCPNLLRSGHFHPLYHDAGKSGQQDNHSGTPSEYHTGKPEYHNTVISRGKILRHLQNDPLQKRDRHNGKLRQNKLPQTGKQYLSDLRGITENIDFKLDNKQLSVEATGNLDTQIGKMLVMPLKNTDPLLFSQPQTFNCKLKLNGSSNINFIPIGKTTKVHVTGNWKSPGFIGNFSPEHHITENGFEADWSILSFNRSIPEMWIDYPGNSFDDSSFGVSLIDPVNHYQQNMRSAKYAIMFIALTFVVFFFVEILTRKRIHPIQYLLVGFALILFYSLLLSISEQINFGTAYLIASIATIGLITAYTHSIFKNKIQTGALTGMLCLLYIFLYVVLQLEDVALLIGSIGLFVILGTIMFFSRKISWYKQEYEYPQIPETDK